MLRRREMRERIRIENRRDAGPGAHRRAAGRSARPAFDTRTGEFVTVARRRGHPGHRRRAAGSACPASGYLYGTYENPTNAGDGYAMAYHAGAELTRHRVLPDQPADQGLQRPGLRVRRQPVRRLPGQRRGRPVRRLRLLVGADDGRGQGARSTPPAARSTSSSATCPRRRSPRSRAILHTTERPTRGTFHAGRGHDYRTHDIEMHISEIGLCGGHSASGRVGRRARARPRCPACTRPATWPACRTTT